MIRTAGVALLASGCDETPSRFAPETPIAEDPSAAHMVRQATITSIHRGAVLTWQPVEGALSYQVYIAEGDVSLTITNWEAVGATLIEKAQSPLTIDSLLPDKTYSVVVSAVGAGGESRGSKPLRATPFKTGLPDTDLGWFAENDHRGRLGTALEGGRIDDDEYADLVVSAPAAPTGGRVGVVYVYSGNPAGPDSRPTMTLRSPSPTDESYGASLATVDINADGFDEILIGAPGADAGRGRAELYGKRCATCPFELQPLWQVTGVDASSRLGASVAGIGDVNGDGFDDVALGAPGCQDTFTDGGCVSIYHGSALGLSDVAQQSYRGPQLSSYGSAVGGAGDVNGDGFSDLIVAAEKHDLHLFDEGRAYVYHGGTSGLSQNPDWFIDGPGASLDRVAGIGDANGDGFDDVAVAVTLMGSSSGSKSGGTFIFAGGLGGLGDKPANAIAGASPGARFGSAIVGLGDLNADGMADVLIGSPGTSYGLYSRRGEASIYLGEAGPMALQSGPNWTTLVKRTDNRERLDEFGNAAARLGDLNGDGSPDIAIGAWNWDKVADGDGAVTLFYGRPVGGPVVEMLHQRIAGVGEAIALDDVAFTLPGPAPADCHWNWGDGSSDTAQTACSPSTAAEQSHAYNSAGIYEVRLSVVSARGLLGESLTQVHASN